MNHDHPSSKRGGLITRRRFLQHSASAIAGIAAANCGLALAAPPLEAVAATGIGKSMINTQHYVTAPAYLARPSGNGTFPAVIVLHTSQGLTADIKHTADRLAEAGFVALAPDLYRGQWVADVHQWAANTDIANTLVDIQQGIDFLMTQGDVKRGQVGVLAFGFSDSLAFALAERNRRIGATVLLYDVGVDPVRLMPLPTAFRAADPRGFGPLILNTYSRETPRYGRVAATTHAWERALRWFKYNLSA